MFSSQQSHQHSEQFEDPDLTMRKSSASNALFNACLFILLGFVSFLSPSVISSIVCDELKM